MAKKNPKQNQNKTPKPQVFCVEPDIHFLWSSSEDLVSVCSPFPSICADPAQPTSPWETWPTCGFCAQHSRSCPESLCHPQPRSGGTSGTESQSDHLPQLWARCCHWSLQGPSLGLFPLFLLLHWAPHPLSWDPPQQGQDGVVLCASNAPIRTWPAELAPLHLLLSYSRLCQICAQSRGIWCVLLTATGCSFTHHWLIPWWRKPRCLRLPSATDTTAKTTLVLVPLGPEQGFPWDWMWREIAGPEGACWP